MISLEKAKEELRSEYNDNLEIFEYINNIRLTNGSAAMYVDIEINDGEFVITGRRYGEKIHKRCERTSEALLNELSKTI